MRKIKVEDAIGQTLCHDMTAIMADGFKGVKFYRGHVIEEKDIQEMLDMGKNHIFVWEPEADEVHEDDASQALTAAMCGANIIATGPSEGKMQISSTVKGLFCVNKDALCQINSVDDYTVATRPDLTPVTAGEKLAGARIVPLVTKRANVEQAVSIAKANAPVLEVKPFLPLKVGVIITGSEIYYGRIQDRFEPILTDKLISFGAQILGFTKCPDDLAQIAAALAVFRGQDADLVLFTGGMSVDPDDLTPTAIRQSGARMVTQGVPMQPGNMLTMAYLDKTMLIGVPGASLHSPTTSLDVFLPRVFAGLEITRADVVKMGVGGFCMGCKNCNFPLCYFGAER